MWELEKYDGRTAIIDDKGVQATYHDLAAVQQKMAAVIGRRTLVISLCRNSIGSVAGYAALINLRIVPVMLNANLEASLMENLFSIYLPAYIWLPSDMASGDIFAGMEKVYSEYDYSLLKTAYSKEYPMYGELGLLLTTSGSTGSPKFVRQSYTNILSNAQSIVSYLKIDERERPVTTLPMNYTYGLSIINSHLLVGAAILVTEKSLMQKEFWTFFREQKATSFGGVPYTYEMFLIL